MALTSISDILFAILIVFVFTVVFVVPIVILIRNWRNRTAQKDQPILSGKVMLIYKEERCARIVEDGDAYELAKGERKQILNLQDQGFPLDPHSCYTSDRARIRVTAYAVWSISNVRDLLRSASISDDSLRATVQMAILPVLTETTAGYKLEEITGRIGEIARITQKEADTWLKRYGLALHRVSITHIQLPDPTQPGKPDGHKEAERLTTLNGIVPGIDEKTLNYAQRMRELELASAKESRTKKKM